MSVKSFFEGIFFGKKQLSAGEVVKDLAESYAAIEAAGDADPVEATISEIREIIRNSEHKNETAERILRAVIDEENLPDIVSQQLSVAISQSKVVSDSVIPTAIENSESNVPDEVINGIIEEGDVNLAERFRLLKNFDDEGLLEDRVKSEVEILYRSCKDKKDSEVTRRLMELQSIADEGAGDIDFTPYAERIISKKIAENYYNDLYRTSMTFAFSQVVPYSTMFADGVAEMAAEEFKAIEEQRGEKPGRYKVGECRRQFLKEIAKVVGQRYRETKGYVIPRSESMKNISQEEEDFFLKTIQWASGSEFSKKERRYVTEQIRGVIRSDSTRAMLIIAALKEMTDLDDGVERVTNILTNKANVEVLLAMEENGLLKRLSLLPQEKRVQALEMIETAFSKRAKAAEAKATEVKPPEVSAAEAPKSEVSNGGQQKKLKLTPDGDGEFSDR